MVLLSRLSTNFFNCGLQFVHTKEIMYVLLICLFVYLINHFSFISLSTYFIAKLVFMWFTNEKYLFIISSLCYLYVDVRFLFSKRNKNVPFLYNEQNIMCFPFSVYKLKENLNNCIVVFLLKLCSIVVKW